MIGYILAAGLIGVTIGYMLAALCRASAYDDYRYLAIHWRNVYKNDESNLANALQLALDSCADDLDRLTSGDRSVLERGDE